MRAKEWVAISIAVATALISYGGTAAVVGTIKDDVKDLKIYKDKAIDQMGEMNGKLDALLQANGVEYHHASNNH